MNDEADTDDGADDALVETLRRAATSGDPVPAHVVAAARAAFLLRDLDAELAALVSDSADSADASADALAAPVLMRADGGVAAPRMLSFEAGEVTIDVEVTGTDGDRHLVGLATGATPGPLDIEYDDGRSVSTTVDELGRFAADVPAGRARLRIGVGEGSVVTSWTTL